jgi:hypothetical protein
LVVNNVVQEPGSGKAYTASGTTLTLSAALTNGTDTMYCVFLGRALQTVNPPNGSVGTSQIADDAVTKAKTSALMFPAFEAYLSSSQSISSSTNTKAQFNTEVFDSDNCYDNSTNYRFTPTTAGKYFVYSAIRAYAGNNNDLDRVGVKIYKNGSEWRNSFMDSGSTSTAHIETEQVLAILDMNGSSDYVEIFGFVDADDGSGAELNDGVKGCYFGAYRIGD